MKKTLAIVILTWNDYKNTIKCLNSIINQLDQNKKIFLVDNNSSNLIFNDTIKWLKKKCKNKVHNKILKKIDKIPGKILSKKSIFIIKNKNNLGCGLGHNTGYKFALKNNFEFIARIDNDMIVPKNFFKKILKNFSTKHIQAISPKILYTINPKMIWWMGTSIGHSLKFDKHMRNYPHGLMDNRKFGGLIETDAIAGCASIMRTSRLKKIGLSDKDFFYGPEDVEFSRRIFTSRGSLIVDRNIKIYHSVTQSFINLNKRKIYYEYKYRLLLIKKIGSTMDKLIGYTFLFIKFLLYILFSFKEKHKYKLRPVSLAWKDFFLNRFGKYDRQIKSPF
tara:strand:- start:489 stop:1490 length:1002 start_codon:yes stop_codon:yes gene_type:complete